MPSGPQKKFWIPTDKETISRTARRARKTRKRAGHATQTYTIGDRAIKKPDAEVVSTMYFATNSSQRRVLFESERSALPQNTNSGSAGLYPSPDDVMNIEKIFLTAKTESLHSAERQERLKIPLEAPVGSKSQP